MKQKVIAIDGPAGAGKSTVAKMVAEKLGFVYIDTGAMYRAVACSALQQKLSPEDVAGISALAQRICVRFVKEAGVLRVRADGSDVTEAIRTPEVTALVPEISQNPLVREAMVRLQREMAADGKVVLDGRDIGTVVIPQACAKIFLTASPQERARRRWLEMKDKGYDQDLAALQAEMEQRDKQDSERELAPLLQAPDAQLVDTTGLSIEAVVALIVEVYQARCNENV